MLSNSVELVNKEIPDFGGHEVYAHSLYRKWRKKHGNIMVLNPCSDINITHGVIAHEAVHLAGFVADICGIVPDFNNDEPIAYLVEWITDQAHKFLKEKGFELT